MKKSQLNAISYAYARRERERLERLLDENGLREEFRQSRYKTVRGFLKSKGIDVRRAK